MPLVTTRALVLQAFAYSETSKILRLLTEAYGLRSVIAKGAQRPKSRFSGVLEPFTEGFAHFYLREGRDLHTLGGFDLIRSRQQLGRDLTRFAGSSFLCELALRFATDEPAPQLFETISSALDRISALRQPPAEPVVTAAAWSVIALLGYRPELAACVSCGSPIDPDAACRFDVAAGGIACTRCRPGGRIIDPGSRAELLDMVEGIGIERAFATPKLQRDLLRAFVGAHLAHEHPLRSLDLYLQQLP